MSCSGGSAGSAAGNMIGTAALIPSSCALSTLAPCRCVVTATSAAAGFSIFFRYSLTFFAVFGPQIPSTLSMVRYWNCLTPSAVAGPYTPSVILIRLGMTRHLVLRASVVACAYCEKDMSSRARWSRLTGSPRLPILRAPISDIGSVTGLYPLVWEADCWLVGELLRTTF